MKIDDSHINDPPELEVVESLETMGYPIDVLESHIVGSESTDQCYVVQKIRSVPNPDNYDAVADEREFVVCSCSGYLFHNSPVTDSGPETLGDATMCKHGSSIMKSKMAANDDAQEEL